MKMSRSCFSCDGDGWEEIELGEGYGILQQCYVCEGTGEVEDSCYCHAYCSCECICGAWADVKCDCWDY